MNTAPTFWPCPEKITTYYKSLSEKRKVELVISVYSIANKLKVLQMSESFNSAL
jgi:hypothetical protein